MNLHSQLLCQLDQSKAFLDIQSLRRHKACFPLDLEPHDGNPTPSSPLSDASVERDSNRVSEVRVAFQDLLASIGLLVLTSEDNSVDDNDNDNEDITRDTAVDTRVVVRTVL